MKVGEQVTFYTHQGNDGDNTTVDELAFVTGAVNDDIVDVVVFPPGGPTEYCRVSRYNPEAWEKVPGGSYWREAGSEAPKFEEFRHSNTPEWHDLRRRQQEEWQRTPSNQREPLREKFSKQQADLDKKLDDAMPKPKAEEIPGTAENQVSRTPPHQAPRSPSPPAAASGDRRV